MVTRAWVFLSCVAYGCVCESPGGGAHGGGGRRRVVGRRPTMAACSGAPCPPGRHRSPLVPPCALTLFAGTPGGPCLMEAWRAGTEGRPGRSRPGSRRKRDHYRAGDRGAPMRGRRVLSTSVTYVSPHCRKDPLAATSCSARWLRLSRPLCRVSPLGCVGENGGVGARGGASGGGQGVVASLSLGGAAAMVGVSHGDSMSLDPPPGGPLCLQSPSPPGPGGTMRFLRDTPRRHTTERRKRPQSQAGQAHRGAGGR